MSASAEVEFVRRVRQGNVADSYKFTGKERDSDSGNDYFGARYYASTMGRFMKPDWSSVPSAVPYAHYDNPQSLNLYSYTKNNPTTRTDPNGHCTNNGEQKSGWWCFWHYSDQDRQRDAARAAHARVQLSAMRGLVINGQPAKVWAKTATDQQVISAQSQLAHQLAMQSPFDFLIDDVKNAFGVSSSPLQIVGAVAPILEPFTVDSLGKIHQDLPDHISRQLE